MIIFWVCTGIAVAVFSVLIYTLVAFRHSEGATVSATEIIWATIPFLILVVIGAPAAWAIMH